MGFAILPTLTFKFRFSYTEIFDIPITYSYIFNQNAYGIALLACKSTQVPYVKFRFNES